MRIEQFVHPRGRRLVGSRLLCALTLALLPACDTLGSDSARSRTAPDSASTGVRETPSDAEDASAAAAVVREYYDAIAAQDYRRAYLLWGDSGRASDKTFDEFRAGFAGTDSVSAHIGEPGRIEGAAGSRYIEIPVEIEAETTSDTTQRFGGTYVLRRSEVEGATPSLRRWHIYGADIAPCPGGCARAGETPIRVADVVHRFGERLRMVSTLGPTDTVARAIREQYAPFVTPELLGRWMEDPADAPGRQVSSPWPQRVEISDMRPDGEDRWLLTASLVYVTSADTMSAVDREPVTVRVVQGEDGAWRIADLGPVRTQ
jgi:hypothetical protein